MKETFYFSHDYNARTDSRIKKLLTNLGMLGYGVYWAIIEDLYQNANALPTDYDSIAYDLHCDVDLIKNVILNYKLFVIDDDTFGSLSVQKRLDKRDEKSNKARESAFKRWGNDANALPTHSEPNAIKESKVKDIKEKEIKEKKKKFIPPTLLEVQSYFKENGYINAEKAFKYYSAADWHDANDKPVKNWKQKMQGVWFKDENKSKSVSTVFETEM